MVPRKFSFAVPVVFAMALTSASPTGELISSKAERKAASLLTSEKEDQRRLEVCGKKYVEEMDSISDYSAASLPRFPARVKVLVDAHNAIATRLAAIRSAKISVDLGTYIFQPDESSLAIMDELRKAIRDRGVSVRILVDSAGSFHPSQLNHSYIKSVLFVEPGVNAVTGKKATVDVVIFRPLLRVQSQLDWATDLLEGKDLKDRTVVNRNRRSHDKILIIDRELRGQAMAIIGGRNITNHYFGVPEVDEHTYEDMEIMLRETKETGAVNINSSLGKHYKKLMCHRGNDWLNNSLTPDVSQEIEGASDRLLKLINVKLSRETVNTGFFLSQVDFANEIENIKRSSDEVFQDPDRSDDLYSRNGDSIVGQMTKVMQKADKTIDLVSPYLYLTTSERVALKEWVMRKPGRKVRIVTNSIVTSDNLLAQTIVDTDLAPGLMESGEYTFKDAKGRESKRHFDNSDGKILVYEMGKLDSHLFGGKAKYGKLHAKYAVIDGEISIVTSHNLDPRSRQLNSEVGFLVYNKQVAADLTKAVDKKIKRSYRWGSSEWQEMIARPELEGKQVWIGRIKEIFARAKSLQFSI